MTILVVTPGQLARRAELYYQISQLVSAGIGLVQAIEQLERNPPSRSFRQPLRLLLVKIHEGASFSDALRATSGWLPQFDISLIEAGERSGRIDVCLRVLSDYYNARARLMKQMLSQLMYPLGLVHFAALVFLIIVPFAGSQFQASIPFLLLKTALILSPIYLGTAFLVYAMQSRHGERWRSIIESSLLYVPLIGTARRDMAMARLSLALEALINAGVNIIEAWPIAAEASASPRIKRAVAGWKPLFADGHTPAELLADNRVFPGIFTNFYSSGEVSGRLDESMKRLHTYYQEEGTRKMEMIAQWTPRIIYGIVAGIIAYKIIGFYSNYFQQIGNLTNSI